MNDNFWDALRKKVTEYRSADAKDTTAVEITAESSGAPSRGGERVPDLFPDSYRENKKGAAKRDDSSSPRLRESDRYSCENSLIQSVRIYTYDSSFNYYARFENDARRGFYRIGVPAPRVSYFAYTPQYATLNSAQLAYYLYFRESARRGEYIEADFSYILLLVYEILNLPDMLPPTDGIKLLTGVWLHYRQLHHQLDKYLVEWAADYCLIHHLPLPKSLYPILPELVRKASLKAFYIPLDANLSEEEAEQIARTLIVAATDHDIKNNNPLEKYEKQARMLITGSIADLLKRGCLNPAKLAPKSISVIERDAFCGALVARSTRRRIDVTRYPVLRSQEYGIAVSAAVRYAENKVREIYKIHSRLKTQPSDEIKNAIDAYFSELIPRKTKPKELPDYERQYDAINVATNSEELFSQARELEASSWENVDILEITDGAEADSQDASAKSAANMTPEQKDTENSGDPFYEYHEALLAALHGDLRRYCRDNGYFEDDLAAKINEIAQDALGDSLLEATSSGYTVIEDYRDLPIFSL